MAVVSCLAAYLIRHFGQNSLIMVAIVMTGYALLQRRAARWLR